MDPKKVSLTLLLIATVASGLAFRSWNPWDLSLANETLTDIQVHQADSSQLLIASRKALYLREGEGKWKRLFSWEGKRLSPKQLISHPELPDKIFLLAQEGVMEVPLKEGPSKWIFQEKNPSKNRVYALAFHPDDARRIYIGTQKGLFQSQDGGRSWSGPLGWPENEPVKFIAFLPSRPHLFLLGNSRELFFSTDEGDSFESAFSLPLLSQPNPERDLEALPEEPKEPENPPQALPFSSHAYSLRDPSQLWVGTREGVFESRDGGITWQRLPDRGLENREVHHLLFSERSGTLLMATSRQVARFHPEEKRWETLSLGFLRPPRSLALRAAQGNKGEVLLIASGTEILEWALEPIEVPYPKPPFLPSPERVKLLQKLIALEPTAREVQKQAIRYADLGNGRFHRWQGGSRLRAFIPSFTFGKKLSLNNNIDIDRGGTNAPDVFILGPDKVDKGWDLGFRWELGDFLYSTAQTSIDSRQKLNVELRESILSEVTRIYFERRRVQMEIALSPPEATQEYFDLLLRLDELTAHLDALTDGFLSRKLEQIYQNLPELSQIYSRPLEDSRAQNSNV